MRPSAEVEGPPDGAVAAPSGWTRARQDVAIVLWPSFLVAAAATVLFFAVFDPLRIAEGTALDGVVVGRNAGYALGFFLFWLLSAAASSLTLYLARTQRPERAPPVESWMRDIP